MNKPQFYPGIYILSDRAGLKRHDPIMYNRFANFGSVEIYEISVFGSATKYSANGILYEDSFLDHTKAKYFTKYRNDLTKHQLNSIQELLNRVGYPNEKRQHYQF